MKILIVDDSLVSRLIVRRCIEAAGVGTHEFCFSGDGEQALEVIEAGGIDVLVSDLNMPVLDGHELLRAIKESDLDLRLTIIMTSAVSLDLLQDLVRVGVDAVINKPLTVAAFTNAFSYLRPETNTYRR